MKHTILLGILLVLPATAFAQNFFPAKDLAFAQIAAGGGYETVLNVTNRGTSAYNGSLTLIPTDTAKPFNLLVNGNQLTGPLNLALAPDTTATLRITSGNESAGTVSGFATIRDADRDKTSLLEGNLTYYVNGKLVNQGFEGSLTEGKLLFQSEGAEVYFRRIELEPLP